MKLVVKCLVIVAVLVAAAFADYSFISISLEMSSTCILWANGRVFGWIDIIIFCLVIDALITIPAWLIWEDIDNL